MVVVSVVVLLCQRSCRGKKKEVECFILFLPFSDCFSSSIMADRELGAGGIGIKGESVLERTQSTNHRRSCLTGVFLHLVIWALIVDRREGRQIR